MLLPRFSWRSRLSLSLCSWEKWPYESPRAQWIGIRFFTSDQQTGWTLRRNLKNEVTVISLSRFATSTDQELVKLEAFLSARPGATVKHIIVLVFDNDFVEVQRALSRDLGRSKPRFHLSGRELVRPHYKLKPLDRLMDLSLLFWLLNNVPIQP